MSQVALLTRNQVAAFRVPSSFLSGGTPLLLLLLLLLLVVVVMEEEGSAWLEVWRLGEPDHHVVVHAAEQSAYTHVCD
jgi:hypothetical protein